MQASCGRLRISALVTAKRKLGAGSLSFSTRMALNPPSNCAALNSSQAVVGVQRNAECQGHGRLHPPPHGRKVSMEGK